MSLRLKLPLHGRSHRHNGSDPIRTFIEYDVLNVGDWLYIKTTSDDTLTDGNGAKFDFGHGLLVLANDPGLGNIEFDTQGQFKVECNDFSITGTDIGSLEIDFSGQDAGDFNFEDYNGAWKIRAFGLASSIDMDNSGDIILTPAGDLLVNPVSGDVNIQIPAGKTVTIKSHTGFPQIQWTEGDADVHIPTGGTIIADL